MKKLSRLTSIAAMLLLAIGLGACSDYKLQAQLPPLSADAVILAFGDSLTFGTGADKEQSYPAVLAQLTGLTVINAGMPGEVTTQGVRRLPALLDRYKPQLLLLCHGGNDLLRKTASAVTRNNLEKMITEADQRDIPTLLIGVPQPALMFLEAAPIYNEIAEQRGLVYEGEILPEVEADNQLKSDRIHPNAEGYRRMADAISQLLRDSGAL
jgi:lysophospholipase L1-like esterase